MNTYKMITPIAIFNVVLLKSLLSILPKEP